MKPDFPIDTPEKVTAAREYLGLTKESMAVVLRLGPNGRATVRRLEQGGNDAIPGPTQIALEHLVEKSNGGFLSPSFKTESWNVGMIAPVGGGEGV